MLNRLTIPTHRADAPGVFILPHDTAWDMERIRREHVELALEKIARDLRKPVVDLTAEERRPADAAGSGTAPADVTAAHPFDRYQAGATRYDVQAPDQSPSGPVTSILDYLKSEDIWTTFELRRVSWRDRARIDLIRDPIERWERWIRAGVAAVNTADTAGLTWRAETSADQIPEGILAALFEAEGGLNNIILIAGACSRYSAPLTESEGKR